MAEEDEKKTASKPKPKKAAKPKAERPWPPELWRLKPGARLVMTGTNAIVATVDRMGRPETVATRDGKGKVVNVPFDIEKYVRLK
jgi:hypothetical protein